MSDYQYMLSLAKVQINLLLQKYDNPEEIYMNQINDIILEMIFLKKTVDLMKDYAKGVYDPKTAKGFCPIKIKLLKNYLKSYVEHLKIFYLYINEIEFICPPTEEELKSLNEEDIQKFLV